MDLNRQLPGWGQDDGPGLSRPSIFSRGVIQKILEACEEKRRSFACARLGLAGDILSLNGYGDGLGLNGGAERKACFFNALRYSFVQIEAAEFYFG